MIGVAGLRRGMRALDVGCGPGALTQALVALLGPENVAAIDPSENFVAACKARVPETDVRVGVAEELPFRDGEFGAVLAQLVVDGMDDARRGLREMRRVAEPGGVLVACVWDFDGGMPLLNAMWAAALALDADRARSFRAEKQLPFSRHDELEELWSSTGLEDVFLGELIPGAHYDGIDDLWGPFEAGVGNLGKLVLSLDDEGRERMKAEVASHLGAPAGPFRLTARALYVRGTVPAG
jgi:ubiquinone/menaquinone biosynthesis C-methylase UbiE